MMSDEARQQRIQVWAVLNGLAVSLRRIGEYEIEHGEAAAQRALLDYLGPTTTRNIAQARRLIVEVLERHDPTIMDHLEELSDGLVPYLNGPAT
jgi:hypothetical protein